MDNVWTNLGNRLETAWKRPTRPNSKRPKDGEIIDEEKSVRWNREEVVRRQKAWDAESIMKSHEAPVTESMQQCIDYIKQNEDEIAEYVNSLFLAQKDVIREQLLESLAAMLNPIPTHYEWRSNDCPYDYSGELYEDGKVSLEQTVSEFLESEYTGASRATYVSHYGLSYNTYGDSLSDNTLEIGCSIMTDGIKDFVQRNAGIPCERFSREEFFDIKTECNEFDPIYDECRASDFFWATAAVEFAGIDKMTLKEVLAAV